MLCIQSTHAHMHLRHTILHRSYMAKQRNCNTPTVVVRQRLTTQDLRLSMLLLDRTAAAASFSSGIADDPIVLPLMSYLPIPQSDWPNQRYEYLQQMTITKHGSLFLANQISQGAEVHSTFNWRRPCPTLTCHFITYPLSPIMISVIFIPDDRLQS